MTRIGARAAVRMLADRDALAAAVTSKLYMQIPELEQRYGETGRAKCQQDMRYNIEHLAPAVELERPVLFEEYVVWVDELLRSRNVATDDLCRAFRLLRREVNERYDAHAALAVSRVIDAGIRRLGQAA